MSKKRKLDVSYQFILDHIDEYIGENKLLNIENNDLWSTITKNQKEIGEVIDENIELSENLSNNEHDIRNLEFRIRALEDHIKELDPDFEVSDIDVWTS